VPVATVLTVALVAAGCREELGPVTFPTTRVTGQVSEGGPKVGGGWIEFWPTEGTVGNLRSAPIGPDGRFDATGVAVGRNVIGLVDAPIRLPGGRELFYSHASPIRRVIPPGPASTLAIDLLAEAIRHQQETMRNVPESPP
jgi:hypothetical protein